jgi:hypothetical protein
MLGRVVIGAKNSDSAQRVEYVSTMATRKNDIIQIRVAILHRYNLLSGNS